MMTPKRRCMIRVMITICTTAAMAVLSASPPTPSGVQMSDTFSAKFSTTIHTLTFTGVVLSPTA